MAQEELLKHIEGKAKFLIIVKPNAKKTELVEWDEQESALRISIAAPADDNKANLEVIKFFSKLLKKRVGIASGLTSKRKLLDVKDPTK